MKQQTTPQNATSQHIPTPLRDWLDKAILSTVADSTVMQVSAEKRKSKILHTILYPLKPSQTKNNAPH